MARKYTNKFYAKKKSERDKIKNELRTNKMSFVFNAHLAQRRSELYEQPAEVQRNFKNKAKRARKLAAA